MQNVKKEMAATGPAFGGGLENIGSDRIYVGVEVIFDTGKGDFGTADLHWQAPPNRTVTGIFGKVAFTSLAWGEVLATITIDDIPIFVDIVKAAGDGKCAGYANPPVTLPMNVVYTEGKVVVHAECGGDPGMQDWEFQGWIQLSPAT